MLLLLLLLRMAPGEFTFLELARAISFLAIPFKRRDEQNSLSTQRAVNRLIIHKVTLIKPNGAVMDHE